MTTSLTDGPVRLLLVDDDPLVLSSLRLYFSTPAAESLDVVGEASDGASALELLRTVPVDVIMTDIHMPGMDGVELLRRVRQLEHPPVFIAMTALDQDETMLSILSLGGAGYILKSSRPDFIIDTVRQAVSGGTVVSPQPATRLIRHLPGHNAATDDGPTRETAAFNRLAQLSGNDEQILSLVCAGLSNAEIARETGRSGSAVKKAVSSLLAKFGTESRTRLAVLAVEAGFQPEPAHPTASDS